jgi:gamma-glutamylcyclotransferase (GGCT)/AIG2-like uncharacterized protein YtfP
MSRAVPRFVPLSASELAEAAASSVVCVGDVRWERDAGGGAARLIPALGSALAGRVRDEERVVSACAVVRAVRQDGTLLEVSLQRPAAGAEPPADCVTGAFVYGTLMRGEEREGAIRSVLPGVTPLESWVRGGLVHLGAWPGLVGGDGRVDGELFLTPELEPLLAVLDPIEDFLGFHVAPTEYVRVMLPVFTKVGRTWAWAYRYVGDASRAIPIPSGRWRDAPRRRGHAPDA